MHGARSSKLAEHWDMSGESDRVPAGVVMVITERVNSILGKYAIGDWRGKKNLLV
jgi:hypothetical protein